MQEQPDDKRRPSAPQAPSLAQLLARSFRVERRGRDAVLVVHRDGREIDAVHFIGPEGVEGAAHLERGSRFYDLPLAARGREIVIAAPIELRPFAVAVDERIARLVVEAIAGRVVDAADAAREHAAFHERAPTPPTWD